MITDDRSRGGRVGRVLAVAAALALALLGSCAVSDPDITHPVSASATPDASSPYPTTASSTSPTATGESSANQIVGTVVRFTSERTTVDVTIDEDTPATRDFLSMLPLEVSVQEFSGTEKIVDLPRDLEVRDSPGSDPEDGDLIYYAPWGNLGFYYNAAGVGFSDSTLHIGTYHATEEQLALLEGSGVRIEVVRCSPPCRPRPTPVSPGAHP